VSDNQGVTPTYVSGDADSDGKLDFTETWLYSASGTAIQGAYSNIGTATGSFTDTAGDVGSDSANDGSSYTGLGAATPGLSKGYWANHSDLWSSKASKCLIIGDSNLDGVANDCFDLGIVKAGAVLAANSSTTGDARVIMAGQAEAAQLNAYAAGVTANGLLDKAAEWFYLNGGQDDLKTNVANTGLTKTGGTVSGDEYGNDKKNGFSFLEGTKVTTDSAAWKGDFFTFKYLSNEDGGAEHKVHVTGEGLKNALMAYDHGISGTNSGLVVSSDGSLIGWQTGNVVEHVYANTANAFVAVINEVEHAAGVNLLTGIFDDNASYNAG